MHPAFLCEVERHDDHIAVRLTGELDLAQAPRFTEAALGALRERPSTLEVDLSGLTFLDSTGVRAILEVHQRARGSDSALHLVQGPPRIRRVFELTGLLDRLPFRQDGEVPHDDQDRTQAR